MRAEYRIIRFNTAARQVHRGIYSEFDLCLFGVVNGESLEEEGCKA
jgi:hypothetical protein